jgi:hypothetical protein
VIIDPKVCSLARMASTIGIATSEELAIDNCI